MKVFMISDTHFGDERILRYENRPFSSVEEMDKAIIENWNQVVGEEDTVFHLGDVSSYDPERNKEILSSLHGKKILIMGNHDQNYTTKQWEEMGCPTYPTPAQVKELKEASELKTEELPVKVEGEEAVLEFALPAYGVALIKLV